MNKPFVIRCLVAGIAVAMVQGCGTPAPPKYASPVFQDPAQPQSLTDLTLTLLESQQAEDERLGPTAQPPGVEVPEPPQIQVFSLSDLEKVQLDPLLGQLVRDFEFARLNDPLYQTALYEFQAGMIGADLASLAYTPSVSLSNRFLENESSSRTTVSVTQPVFNMELLATLEEEDSRRAAAQAQMKLREYELIERVFGAVTNLIKAQEKLVVNESRIKTLQDTARGAQRELELGKGTVTDVRDAAVRLEQARAEQIKLMSAKGSALRTLEQLTGRKPDPLAYILRKGERSMSIAPAEISLANAMQYSNTLLQARANQRLAELAALKSKSAYLPSVSITASKSYSDRGDISNSGVNFGVSVPVNAGTFYQAQIASAKISQAQLNTAQVRQKLEVDVEQNHADVLSGVTEVNIRLQAVEAAELSLLATEKSFAGGVRTRLDVLNAAQTVYQVNEQYINSVIDLAKSYLTLSNLSSQQVSTTVGDLQRLLF